MFLIERNLFCCLVTTITSERVLWFDSFQRSSPTFSFVAVLLNCLFLSKFQVVLGVLYKLEKKCFEKQIVLLFGHENSFQVVFNGL